MENISVYQKKSKLKNLTAELKEKVSLDKLGKTAKDTGIDVLTALGGGVVGAAAGRHSLWAGALVTAGGHFFGSSTVSSIGIGMMASGGYAAFAGGLNGTDEKQGIAGIKERLEHYKEGVKRQFFVDKIIKGKKADGTAESKETVSGVKYFLHPSSQTNDVSSDEETLERIERQLEESANQFSSKTQTADVVSGTEDDYFDVSERLV